jgi:hypothetical protein
MSQNREHGCDEANAQRHLYWYGPHPPPPLHPP